MWARIGKKTALNDFAAMLSSSEERSGIRSVAFDLLRQRKPELIIDMIHQHLLMEDHPRIIRLILRHLAFHGNRDSYDLLQNLMLSNPWPGSCRSLVMFALRVLRYRLGLLSASSLESLPQLETADIWQLVSWKMKPASGRVFDRSLRFAQKQIPTLPLDRNFAVEFPCGGRNLCMMIHEELNHIHPDSSLFHQSSLCGILVSEEEDHLRIFGWLLSKPAVNGALTLDVYHDNGQHLYHGEASLIEGALHCDIRTVKGASVPVAAMTFAFRTNQLLSQNRLLKAMNETLPAYDYAQSA